jgi:putative colanic acid biosynthesis UDP-glucose lipid carrier transferase
MPKTGTLKKKSQQKSIVFNVVQEGMQARIVGFTPLDKKTNAILKRAFDLVISSLLIVLICPFLVPLIALYIKLDSKGPVFFIQKRNKREGSVFTCFKFRTMYQNTSADTLPCLENDQRITKAGKYLRKYHLDEIPQLFNVWLGHMSIIGPRPFMINENLAYEKVLSNYSYRQKVKPGITGLAQSFGYYGYLHTIDHLQQRLAYDHTYINDWTFKMDIEIIGRTLKNAFNVRKSEKKEF